MGVSMDKSVEPVRVELIRTDSDRFAEIVVTGFTGAAPQVTYVLRDGLERVTSGAVHGDWESVVAVLCEAERADGARVTTWTLFDAFA